MWQDIAISVMQWIFVIALLPTIFHAAHKPTLITSLINTLGILVIVAAYTSLGLWYSSFGAAFLGLGWATITYQRYRLDASRERATSPED